MGKYGPGVSIKTVITQEAKLVQEILDKGNLSEEDKDTVMGSFKEMAYQWCQANATACAIEDAAKDVVDAATWQMIEMEAVRNGLQGIKMAETYPF